MNLGKLRKGLTESVLTGYDGTGETVALDPKRTPAGNAELYFKKYKKARAGRDIIAVRLHQTEEEVNFLKSLLHDSEKAEDEQALLGIRSKLKEKGYILEVQQTERTDNGHATGPVRRISFQGWEIVVGKNAAGNDFITTRLARSNDLWLHAEGLPGSHVLVRDPERKGVPHEVLLKAAGIAAYYSRGRSSGKIPVTYTDARNVKKPKGAKRGLVVLFGNKTIMAVPDSGAICGSDIGKQKV